MIEESSYAKPGTYVPLLAITGNGSLEIAVCRSAVHVQAGYLNGRLESMPGFLLGAVSAVLVFILKRWVEGLLKSRAAETQLSARLRDLCTSQLVHLEERPNEQFLELPKWLSDLDGTNLSRKQLAKYRAVRQKIEKAHSTQRASPHDPSGTVQKLLAELIGMLQH